MLRIAEEKNKTFEERFVDVMSKLPLYSEEWTNYNPSDPGITILENLTAFEAVQAESILNISYEAKVGLLRLAGIVPGKAKSARVLISADNLNGKTVLPDGQKLFLGDMCFETNRPQEIGSFHILGIYAKREEDLGSELLREVERVVLLKVVDTKWMAHIDDMDELKKGISLRSYGQKNPVVEYRMEGFEMFDAMVDAIREETVRMLFTIQVRKQGEQPQAPKREQVLNEGPQHHSLTRRVKKVGPNDPCPCGSGKKYKKCCGANKQE